MSIAIDVLIIVALFSASALCVALIIYLSRITKTITDIQSDIAGLTERTRPILEKTADLGDKLNDIADITKEQVVQVKTMVTDVKGYVDDMLTLGDKVKKTVEDPVAGLIKNLTAVSSGVSMFLNTYKRRRGNHS